MNVWYKNRLLAVLFSLVIFPLNAVNLKNISDGALNSLSQAASSVTTTVCEQPGRCIAAGLLAVTSGICAKAINGQEESTFLLHKSKWASVLFGSVVGGGLGWACYHYSPTFTRGCALVWGVPTITVFLWSRIYLNRNNRNNR